MGTNADNVRDRVARGRKGDISGDKNGRAKLTWKDVKFILKHYNGKYGNVKYLREKFNVSHPTIWLIISYKSWV